MSFKKKLFFYLIQYVKELNINYLDEQKPRISMAVDGDLIVG